MAGRRAKRTAAPQRRRLPTRTKIVATLGPSSRRAGKIRELIRAGVDVFRFNFSHGTHEEHGQAIREVRRMARLEGVPVAILADLQGPKIRIGPLRGAEPIWLDRGDKLDLVCEEGFVGHPGEVGCTYPDLCTDVSRGDRLLLDDGSIELRVEKVEQKRIRTKVRFGGILRQHKGVNLPGTSIHAPSLTEKDLFDLGFALTNEVDFVALSFVRGPEDVRQLADRIRDFGSDARIVAKIERPEAVKRFDEVLEVSDAIMIARGDMGVELGPEAVPAVQKEIIRKCIQAGKPVITATQMLESMTQNPRPTRAEVSDVANAILDGTSALMLSAETASGRHPVRAVRVMDRIARTTESEMFPSSRLPGRRISDLRRFRRHGAEALSIEEATVSAAAKAALEVDAEAVVVFTETGKTPGLMARERIPTRILALTSSYRAFSRMALSWGVVPVLTRKARSVEQMFRIGEERVLDLKHLRPGDRVVFIAGTMQVSGATNTVTIRRIG
ncbi:MAG: pyruvate kinase [Planctomycetota bacterium]